MRFSKLRFSRAVVLVASSSLDMAYPPYLLPAPLDYYMTGGQPTFFPAHIPFPSGLSVSSLLKYQQGIRGSSLLASELFQHQDPYSALRGVGVAPPLDTGVDPDIKDDPKADLEGLDLWKEFHKLGTEMVITKSGR